MPATVHRLETAAARRDARAGKPDVRPPPLGEEPGFDFLALFILLVGLAPFVGLAITRDWSPAELGIGAVMVIFAARELLVHCARRLRHGGEPPRGR
jgi:hypothetical protein